MDDIYGPAWCRRRRLKMINLQGMLNDREMGIRPSGTSFLFGGRYLQQCVVPSRSVHDVERPACFLRRFTPDGRRLLAISANQHDLLIFDYLGVQEANDVRLSTRQLFSKLFCLRHTVAVVSPSQPNNALLSRDCLLVTQDSRHALLVYVVPLPEQGAPLSDMYRNNESLTSHTSINLENYHFCCVDLQKAELSGGFSLRCDKLWPGQSVHLRDRLLAVLSVQHQTIHLHVIDDSGAFLPVHQIGRCIFDDDMIRLPPHTYSEAFLTGFKQRFLTAIWRQFEALGKQRRFFHQWNYFHSMKMWRFQLLEGERVLIRFITEQTMLTREGDLHLQPGLFAIFDWKTAEILVVFDWTMQAFLELYEQCAEQLRFPGLPQHFPATMSMCGASLDRYNRLKRSLTNARGGSVAETQRRILSHLPFSQTSPPSSYLDPAIFSYDDRLTRQLDRGTVPTDTPLRVFCRRANSRLAYAITWSTNNRTALANLLFHPFDPLIIIFDRTRPEAEANIGLQLPASAPREVFPATALRQ